MHYFSHRLELAGGDTLYEIYNDVEEFLTLFYLHFRNSSKEWTGLQKVGNSEDLLVVTIPKPFGTRFVAYKRAALYAMRINWVPLIIFFSNKRETENCEESAGWLKSYFLNFEFFMHCNSYADILDWMSRASLAVQSDKDGKSIAEAANIIEKLRLKLTTLERVPGTLQQEAASKLDNAVVIDANDIPNV